MRDSYFSNYKTGWFRLKESLENAPKDFQGIHANHPFSILAANPIFHRIGAE